MRPTACRLAAPPFRAVLRNPRRQAHRVARQTGTKGILMGCRWAFVLASMVLALVGAGGAVAAVFPVDSTADAVDATPGDGTCATADLVPVCTLRAAVQEAN